jgi:hypothetical protein
VSSLIWPFSGFLCFFVAIIRDSQKQSRCGIRV